MKNLKSISTMLISLFLMIFLLIGCNQENSIVQPNTPTNDKEALQKVVDSDEVIQSFEPNYNEDQAMQFIFGKVSAEIFPVKVGQRMRRINREFNATVEGDSAFGTLKTTFEGMLYIIAAYDSASANPFDTSLTLIQKPFTTTVTRNIIFKKRDSLNSLMNGWKIVAVSLPEGGTLTDNISIKSMTVFLPNGDTLNVTSPNDYYLSRGEKLRHLIPIFDRFEPVKVQVEVSSVYQDPDFVTLTYGGVFKTHGLHRAKRKFEMVSEEFDGTFYNRVYEGTWRVNQFPGIKHAIVNAFPRLVIFDDQAPVESNSWGMPYIVK